MSSVFQNEKVQEKVVDWMIDKGGPVSGIALCCSALCWVGLGIIRKSPESVLLGLTFFFLAVAATSIWVGSKRNRQMTATVAAEQIEADPNRPQNTTAVPEVRRALAAMPRSVPITAQMKKKAKAKR